MVKNNKTNIVSSRTYRYINRTIKKVNNENYKNSKYIKELNLALNYYIDYSINCFNYNNYLIDNYNKLINLKT